MSAAHTPGPWTLRLNARSKYFARVDAQDGDGAFMVAEIAGGPGSEYALGEGIANARLIAAAPDLLATVDWLRQTYHRAHHEGALETCEKSTCQAARDAMAKASPP